MAVEMRGIRKSDWNNFDDSFVVCRTLMHAWDEVQDDGGVRRSFSESRTVRRVCFRCIRCGTLRYEAWSSVTGDLLFRDYRHPDGYAMKGIEVHRTDFRREYLSRYR